MRRPPASESGFSLLEVVITIAILMTLTVGVASMLKAGFEVREGLGERAKTLHRLSVAVSKLSDDLQHAFLVSQKDQIRGGIDRNMKTVFRLEKSLGDKLSMTTMTHRALQISAYESEFTFVVYQLKESKDAPGRKDLCRAETPVIPLDLKEEPPTTLLAHGIKTFTLEAWTGDRWSKDAWDSARSETRNIMPKMVRVTIEAYLHDRAGAQGSDVAGLDEAVLTINTVVYLNGATDFVEMKEPDKSMRWGAL